MGRHHSPVTPPLANDRVRIRPATASDQATLVEFRLAMFADMRNCEPGAKTALLADLEALRASNLRWMAEHFGRDFIAWVVDLDGRTVASAGLLWFAHPPGPRNPGGREAYILNVYTRPEARRMGLARALMERVVEEARAADVRRIWLRASADGRPLYEAIGFAVGNYLELTCDWRAARGNPDPPNRLRRRRPAATDSRPATRVGSATGNGSLRLP